MAFAWQHGGGEKNDKSSAWEVVGEPLAKPSVGREEEKKKRKEEVVGEPLAKPSVGREEQKKKKGGGCG